MLIIFSLGGGWSNTDTLGGPIKTCLALIGAFGKTNICNNIQSLIDRRGTLIIKRLVFHVVVVFSVEVIIEATTTKKNYMFRQCNINAKGYLVVCFVAHIVPPSNDQRPNKNTLTTFFLIHLIVIIIKCFVFSTLCNGSHPSM